MKKPFRAALVTLSTLITVHAFANEPEAVPGEYVVKLKSTNSLHAENINNLQLSLRSQIQSQLKFSNFVVVKRPSFETSASALSVLSESPEVEYAEPNYIYRTVKSPNDPMLAQLWGMDNATNAAANIGAIKAWDIQTGNKDLLIAVIDTGVDYTHPDIAPNAWINQAEKSGKAGVDDDGNGYVDDIHGYNFVDNKGDSKDDQGHGTHCSGTIGGKGNNGVGVAGVVWDAKIIGAKFLSKSGSGTLEGAINAIDYSVKMGAKILSNSWGGGGFSKALLEVIESADKQGVLFVAAAGNETNNNDTNPSYPASYNVPNIISVAAIDSQGKLARFSNFGKKSVHVAAPGVDIMSTVLNGKYDKYSGTSMATPHVSGIAALLLSNEPNLTHLQIKERILATAVPSKELRGKVQTGMANAFTTLTNQVPAPDMNDPVYWNKVAVQFATPHPYKDKSALSFVVGAPGAKQIAIRFSQFNTEEGYDFVIIKDQSGKVLEKLSGNLGDTMSAVIDGDQAVVEFVSDDSVNAEGFEITEIAWK